jgi:putative transcriptional regulator
MRSVKFPFYLGGPVGAHELTIVSFDWVAGEAKITFHSQLSLDQVKTLAGSGSKLIRAFVGYAGWSGGQLETELQQSAVDRSSGNRIDSGRRIKQ